MKPTTLYIDGFVKPFTLGEVKELISHVVKPIDTEEHFFMNVPKTYCYVTYPSMEDARKAKEDLYLLFPLLTRRNGKQFPEKFGNKLRVRFTSISAASMKRDNKSAKEEDEPSEKRQKVEPKEVVPLESLFHKTKTRPVIFYKPLTETEVSVLRRVDE